MERDYGTELRQTMPWGLYVGGKALCSDGKVRTLKRISETADTFFSIPAAVRVKGKTVSGWVSVEATDGADHENGTFIKFNPYRTGENGQLLPEWPAD